MRHARHEDWRGDAVEPEPKRKIDIAVTQEMAMAAARGGRSIRVHDWEHDMDPEAASAAKAGDNAGARAENLETRKDQMSSARRIASMAGS